MTHPPHLGRLDAADPDEVAEYERAFYAAFARATGNRLIRDLWRWDEAARRLATRISYDDQIIYLQRDAAGRIDAAIATNVALTEFQGSAFGFAPPAETGAVCEFLTFFAVADHRLASRFALWQACFADLRRRGFATALATSAERPLTVYRQIGGKVIASTAIDGEPRHLLRFDLRRAGIRNAARYVPDHHV